MATGGRGYLGEVAGPPGYTAAGYRATAWEEQGEPMIPTDPVTPSNMRTKRPLPSKARSTADTPRELCLDKAAELLMDWFGVTAPQADALIATWARDCHRSPRTVAYVLVHHIWEGDGTHTDTTIARTLEHALRSLPGVLAAGVT